MRLASTTISKGDLLFTVALQKHPQKKGVLAAPSGKDAESLHLAEELFGSWANAEGDDWDAMKALVERRVKEMNLTWTGWDDRDHPPSSLGPGFVGRPPDG